MQKIPLFCGKSAFSPAVENSYKPVTTGSFKQFRQGFQQESILLHRGNVENYVESVENPVEYRGKAKNRVILRVKFSVENKEKPAENPFSRQRKVHPGCGKQGSEFYRKTGCFYKNDDRT